MPFDESKHPRAEDGKFTDGNGEDTHKKSDSIGNDQISETEQPVPRRAKFVPTSPGHFRERIIEAKETNPPEDRWRVDTHEITDYENDQLFLTDGGSCVAVETSGNIISVCKKVGNGEHGVAKALVHKAIEAGGDRLDAFGKKLFSFYTRNGFEPISWTPFNEEFAPEGWDKNRDEKEPVIFYKYAGKSVRLEYEEFLNHTKSSSDYDSAMKQRDKEIK